MSQSPSIAGAFHLLSHPCSLVPSPRGKSWCILNLVPFNRADAHVSPSTPLPLAQLSWLLLGCSEGTAVPIPAALHLPAHSPIYWSSRLPSALQCFPSCIASPQ